MHLACIPITKLRNVVVFDSQSVLAQILHLLPPDHPGNHNERFIMACLVERHWRGRYHNFACCPGNGMADEHGFGVADIEQPKSKPHWQYTEPFGICWSRTIAPASSNVTRENCCSTGMGNRSKDMIRSHWLDFGANINCLEALFPLDWPHQ